MQNAAPVQLSQVRDFGQIISTTFVFLRQEWRPLFRALAVICLPPAIIAGFFVGKTVGDIQSMSFGGSTTDPMWMFTGMMNQLLPLALGYLLMLAAFLLMVAVTYEYIRAYHLGEHHGMTPGDLWKRVVGQLGSYLGIGFLSTLLMAVGLVLCILPGFYVMTVLGLAMVAHAMERTGATGSMGRSNNLVRDRFWETLGLILVIGIIQTFITGILMAPFSIVSMVVSFNSTFGAIQSGAQPELPAWMAIYTAFTTALQMALSMLTYPIVGVALALKYFTLVEEKEGVGLRQRMEGFDQA
ncbi:MAG: hypothetical protein JNM62_04325 [Flavobacteriales bacterium]|nr:hypothetical protein [Flavobacteriales bacterium]